ncbi:DUF2157 domain-containing protein [Paenibacillus sp. GCM10023252]|uniref:DUF2157 domain-containing protein n=1 Tax=Paenibacillus sp. GCM10023252 TaxID=3252649 RepID=UPI0036062C95
MSRKWLEQEGPSWQKQGIITDQQLHKLLSLYPEHKRAVGLVPILGSILVALGILSFIAANWQGIAEGWRLVIIAVFLTLFYTGGAALYDRGSHRLGIALLSLGLMTFGAGSILITQMFHLAAYSQLSFTLWGGFGLLLTYLYRSRYLFLISLVLFTVSQWYSSVELNDYNYISLAAVIGGFGYYWLRYKDSLLAWLLAAGLLIQLILFTAVQGIAFAWIFIPIWALYSIMDWMKERRSIYPFQAVPLVAAFLFNLFIAAFWEATGSSLFGEIAAPPLYYLLALLLLFVFSTVGKRRQGRTASSLDWILALPFLYLQAGIDVLYLLTLFIFSLYLLWRGYAEEWRLKINLGTLLFLTSTMTAYSKLTWGFMDKSIFFLIGGALLLILSWLLNRRKQQVLSGTDYKEEDSNHDPIEPR